jgi:hypothetical protein
MGTSLVSIPAGADIWIQQMQPHPFARVEAVTAPNKVKLSDVAGIHNGSTNKWVRFAPYWADLGYATSRGGKMIDQPYRITFTNGTTREITLDRNLHSSITDGMFCIMQPYTDAVGGSFYPTSVSQDRLNFLNTACWMVYSPDNVNDDRAYTGISHTGNVGGTISTSVGNARVDTTIQNHMYIWDPMHNIMKGDNIFEQQWRLPPVGRMVIPYAIDSTFKGFVIEYNGVDGPLAPSWWVYNINGVPGTRPGVFRLNNVKIIRELSHHVFGSWTFGPRTMLIPYQDVDMTPLSIVTFEPTDGDIGYNFNGGTSKHLGWSQPLADQIFATNSATLTETNQDMVTIPARTNYESQHYPDFPNPALRSAPPVFINQPVSETENAPGDSTYTGGGGCIHYDSIVEIWNGESYDKVPIKDVEIGQLIRTPEGPKEVLNRLESRHGHTRIINVRDGRSVHCTNVHPIATVQEGGRIVWKKAAFVEQGEEVMTDIGPQTVDCNVEFNFNGRTVHPFYDLSVAEVFQFFANGILVHNKMKLPPRM